MERVRAFRRTCLSLRVPLLLMLSLVLLSSVAFCQGGTATLLGTVSDKSGAAVPNVKITITNMDNGFVRYSESNSIGSYTATNLPVGRYEVKAEVAGFKTYTESNIVLNVNATVRTNVALEVGAVKESVTVEANALQVQTDTNEVSQAVTDTQITNLATNGRNVIQLTALVPGAASMMPDFDVPVAQYQNRSVNFNGQRSDHNNWLIDGGEAYDRGSGGILIVAPSQDMIQEFKVTTSNYSADLGNSSGGMITMAMKQGSKQYHGSAWEYVRNDALNSYSWNAKNRVDPQNAVKNKLRYNTWGFNLGGKLNPKAENPKTFFFYNMEWRRYINGGTSNNRALTADQRNGTATSALYPGVQGYDLTGVMNPGRSFKVPSTGSADFLAKVAKYGLTPGKTFPGNFIPGELVNADARAFLASGVFPVANTISQGNPVYMTNADQKDNYREEAVRIDRQFTDKLTVMGHLIWDTGTEDRATPLWGGQTYPTVGSAAKVPSWSGVVHATYSISPTLLTEISYNTNGNNLTIDPTGQYSIPTGWKATQMFPGVNPNNKMAQINIQGFPWQAGAFGMQEDGARYPWSNTWRSYQLRDDFSWSHGKHNFRFGAAWMFMKKMQYTAQNVGGGYTFSDGATGLSYADFLLGYAGSYTQPQVRDAVNIAGNTLNLYAQDDWKVSNRLTLNLGVRWEGLPPAYDQNNRLSNFYPELYDSSKAPTFVPGSGGNTLDPTANGGAGFQKVYGVALSDVNFYMNGIGIAGRNGIPGGMVDNTWKTFAPRVGFAYDLTGKGNTVLRGGFGMFYERTAGNEQYNMMNNVPFTYAPSVGNVYLSNPTVSSQTGASVIGSGGYAVNSINTGSMMKHDVPTTLQFNLGIQQGIGGKAVLNLAYVGNTAYHQTDTIEINPVQGDANRVLACGWNCGSNPALASTNTYRPFKGWSNISMVENAANSHYNSMQFSVRSTAWKNLTLSGTWTYAHGFDLVDGELWNGLDNPFDKNYNWGTTGFDRRHVVNVSYVYNLPFFQKSNSNLAKTLLGGWTLSGVSLFSSGTPITIGGKDVLGYGGGTNNHANQVAPVSYPKTRDQWYSTSSFQDVTTNLTWGNSHRSAIIGPGRNNWNISLYKNFRFGEKAGFEFRAESFNTFNHTQWTGVTTGVGDSNRGKINAAADPRIFQLGAKLSF